MKKNRKLKVGSNWRLFVKTAHKGFLTALMVFVLAIVTTSASRAGIVYEFQQINSFGNTVVAGNIDLPSLFGTDITGVTFSYRINSETFTETDLGAGASWEIDGTTGEFLNLVFGSILLDVFGPGSGLQASLFAGVNSATEIFTVSSTGDILSQDSVDHRTVLVDDGGFLDIPVSVVPLPAALPLYGTGLAIMGFIGWRRRQRDISV